MFGASLFSVESFRQIFMRDNSMAGSYYSSTGRQDTTKFDNDKPSPPPSSSSSSKFSDSVREVLHKPDTKKNEKLEESKQKIDQSKPYKTEKASFLDKTDPNEMGRNTDQIISELENEDKKLMSKKPQSPPPPSSSSTTSPPKSENNNNKRTTTTTTTDATSDDENKEANENTRKSDSRLLIIIADRPLLFIILSLDF